MTAAHSTRNDHETHHSDDRERIRGWHGAPPPDNLPPRGRLIDVGYRSISSLDARALWAQAQRSTEQSG